MSSNPYELRAELLKQAEGILTQRYHSMLEEIRWKIDRNLSGPGDVEFPSPPNTDDIIAEAERLYQFVQTK